MYNQFYFIYSIVNTENNKRYIGYTNDLNIRLYDHMTQLELNQHPNLKMQQEFKKENFKIEIFRRRKKFWLEKAKKTFNL